MSKGSKRGMSMEEKQEKMLEIFYETQSFFQLKDLERLGPKTGVISQSVKDVVQNLVDDNLVLKDKVGTSVYFWSLPSSAGNQLTTISKKLEEELESATNREVELQNELEHSKKGREDSLTRETALMLLKKLQKEHKALHEELDTYTGNDPALFEIMKKSTQIAHDAVNRWTENIFILQKWCSSTFPEAKERLEQMYAEYSKGLKIEPGGHSLDTAGDISGIEMIKLLAKNLPGHISVYSKWAELIPQSSN